MVEDVHPIHHRDKADQSDLERRLREEGWPMLLRKATRGPLNFRALLEGEGQPMSFNSAEACGTGWARLRSTEHPDPLFRHGIEVRLDKIVWLAED